MLPMAFSTLGCPGINLRAVAEIASRDGYSGLELRIADGEPVTVALDASARLAVARTLARFDIRPLAIASYVRVADTAADDTETVGAGIAAGRLAADLGADYLRVFPGGPAAGAAADADRIAARRLSAIARGLDGTGVTVAIETHDSHPTGADIRRVTDLCPAAGVIWDVLHTWRSGEDARTTMDAIGDRLAYVQVKDVESASTLVPTAPGTGVLPLDDVTAALREVRYAGWVSWEYERRWFPQVPPLGDMAGGVSQWMRDRFASA